MDLYCSTNKNGLVKFLEDAIYSAIFLDKFLRQSMP